MIQNKIQCVSLFTQTYKKAQYRQAFPFARLQKSQHKYIIAGRLSGLETLPNN